MRTNQLIEHLNAAEQERQQQARSRADDRRQAFAADEHAGIDEACQNHYLLPGGGYTNHRDRGLTTRLIVGDRAFTAAAGRLSPVGQPATVIATPGELADHLQHPHRRGLTQPLHHLYGLVGLLVIAACMFASLAHWRTTPGAQPTELDDHYTERFADVVFSPAGAGASSTTGPRPPPTVKNCKHSLRTVKDCNIWLGM
jgi:hypothetical protein